MRELKYNFEGEEYKLTENKLRNLIRRYIMEAIPTNDYIGKSPYGESIIYVHSIYSPSINAMVELEKNIKSYKILGDKSGTFERFKGLESTEFFILLHRNRLVIEEYKEISDFIKDILLKELINDYKGWVKICGKRNMKTLKIRYVETDVLGIHTNLYSDYIIDLKGTKQFS